MRLQDGESPINSKADSKTALAFVISAKTKIRGNRQTAFSIFAGPKSCNGVSLQIKVSIGEYFHAAKAVVALAALQVNIKLYVASVSLFNPPLFKESAVVVDECRWRREVTSTIRPSRLLSFYRLFNRFFLRLNPPNQRRFSAQRRESSPVESMLGPIVKW